MVLWQAIQALPCPDGGLKRADAYFTYIAGLPADQIAAIAKATGITPAGVLAAGNNCAARIALDGEVDKDKQTADRRPDRTQQEGLERGRQRGIGQAAPRYELSGELQIANQLVVVPPWRNVRPCASPRGQCPDPISTALALRLHHKSPSPEVPRGFHSPEIPSDLAKALRRSAREIRRSRASMEASSLSSGQEFEDGGPSQERIKTFLIIRYNSLQATS